MDRRQELAASCIRVALGEEAPVREVKMFGALCFMVAEKLTIGVMSDGALIVSHPSFEGPAAARRSA